MIFLLFPQFSM